MASKQTGKKATKNHSIKRTYVSQLRQVCLSIYSFFVNNELSCLIMLIYIVIMTTVISWGLPNVNHPFPYFMDESHQLQAIRTVVKYGTSNYPHQENGPMFHYLVSSILVSPLILLKIINPFAIKSAIGSPDLQQAIYISLRATIILFGALSSIVLIKITRMLKVNSPLAVFTFIATPIFLSVSNYFKYDIPFMFWTLLTLYLFLRYSESKSKKVFILAGFTSALAISTKITGAPLFIAYLFTFFYFTPKLIGKNVSKTFKNIQTLIIGVFVYVATFVLVGIPDIVFGGRSMAEYLYYNIVLNPQTDKTFIFNTTHTQYLLFELGPTLFGHSLFILAVVSLIYILLKIFSSYRKPNHESIKKLVLLIVVFLGFAISLSPLWIIAANRALILLPFFIIFVCIFVKDLWLYKSINKFVLILVFGLLASSQIFETYSWISLKYVTPPEAVSSKWLLENIPQDTTIGIENIPVYQQLPDLVLKEFYDQQYLIKKKYMYKYQIIDAKSDKLPNVIILSNANFEYRNRKTSPKKDLVKKMMNEGYKEIKSFSPMPSYYKLFTNDINFVMSGMPGMPLEITVFKKNGKI